LYKTLKIFGFLSIVFGVIASLLCLFPMGIFFAVFAGFLGMIFSTTYIFIDFRYQISTQRFTPGLIGIILSSVPVVLIVIANFSHH
jgi:hypothetical protein